MNEEMMKEFKIFREQVYNKINEFEEILRTLIGSNSEKIVSTFDDENAVKVIDLYPVWKESIAVAVGERYQYEGRLYKVVQAHTTQADWTPDITPSLWSVIDVEHAGTLEDPIPAVASMEYIKGKYYIENGTIYLMNRQGMAEGESIVLHYTPSQLVGQYFEVVQ